jgi:hypothetical protein
MNLMSARKGRLRGPVPSAIQAVSRTLHAALT